jgi:signal transduction histidine kinase
MAESNDSATRDMTPPAEASPQAGTGFGAVRTLRLLVLGTILTPLLLGAVAAYFSYRDNEDRAAAALSEAVAVAEENTTKILDTHVLVAARIDDLLNGLSDDQIRTQEQALHDRIAAQIAGLPQVAAAWVISADGRELVSARVYPVDNTIDQSQRADFRALRQPGARIYIRALRARSLNGGKYHAYFSVSERRQGPDEQFQGIVVVAVSGTYFASFYNSLLAGSTQYDASVIREDGTVLARYPETAKPPSSAQREALAQAIAHKNRSGSIETGSPFGGGGQLVSYRRLSEYPVYVTIGRSRASIFRDWLHSLIGYVVIGVPAAAGLMLLSLIALRRTRREQLALAEARDAVAQRAAVEARLSQAQKLEAVGLLTAGIVHDFNNLLTVISGNIVMLEGGLGGPDARRQKFLSAAATACDRAAELTRRLLAFTRHEPVDPRPVDANEVIVAVLDLPWASSDHITVEFRLAADLWPVFVDPTQLGNSLLNLALNARDAMGGGGRLRIETANCGLVETESRELGLPPGDYVSIAVFDSGSGIPQDVINKVFDPFFTTKAPGKGTGLGLSQVRGFVTRFGGRCAIASEPGNGTTVRICLPRHTSCPADARGEAPAAAESAAQSGDRVGL